MDKNEESFYIRVRMRKEWTPVFLAFRPKFEVLMNGKSWTPLFNSVPAQYRRLKDDGEPITYFDLG